MFQLHSSMQNKRLADIYNWILASLNENVVRSANIVVEWLIVAMLCGIPFTIYFTSRLKSLFDYGALFLLVVWMFVLHRHPQRSIPKHLIVLVGLYMLSFVISVLISDHGEHYPPAFNSLRIPILAGFLFIAPLRPWSRKIVVTVFLLCAGIAGIAGILQDLGSLPIAPILSGRPSGFTPHPITYAAILAFACGASGIMLFIKGAWPYRSRAERVFLLVIFVLTASGILFSQSRGVWIALVVGLIFVAFINDVRKGAYAAITLAIVMSVIFATNGELRQRGASIVTSIYTEDETGSTGNRIELWKGSALIFEEAPLFGTGIWDFDADIKRLISEMKLKNMTFTCHAHNLFFHTLATRGAVGLTTTVALLASLLLWAMRLVRSPYGTGGYIIMLSTIIIIVGGLTEVSLAENSLYSFAYWFSIGLIGPYAGRLPVL